MPKNHRPTPLSKAESTKAMTLLIKIPPGDAGRCLVFMPGSGRRPTFPMQQPHHFRPKRSGGRRHIQPPKRRLSCGPRLPDHRKPQPDRPCAIPQDSRPSRAHHPACRTVDRLLKSFFQLDLDLIATPFFCNHLCRDIAPVNDNQLSHSIHLFFNLSVWLSFRPMFRQPLSP